MTDPITMLYVHHVARFPTPAGHQEKRWLDGSGGLQIGERSNPVAPSRLILKFELLKLGCVLEQVQELRSFFKRYDLDGSGRVTKNEPGPERSCRCKYTALALCFLSQTESPRLIQLVEDMVPELAKERLRLQEEMRAITHNMSSVCVCVCFCICLSL